MTDWYRYPLRKKYRVTKPSKNTKVRGRTGPRCCNDGCPARAGGKKAAKLASRKNKSVFGV